MERRKRGVIETGDIAGAGGRKFFYRMELLEPCHFDIVSALQREIVREIDDPVFYDPVAEESILKRFRSEGRIIGTFVEKRLVGARIIHFPPVEGDNFGKDVGLPPAELPKTAHLAAILVQREFREIGLALKMNLHAVDIVGDLGFTHIFATVFPLNFANVTTLFNTGLIVVGLKNKYGGKPRYIFYRPSAGLPAFPPDSEISIPATDFDAQIDLLNQGFQGFETDRRGGKFDIVYRKPGFSFL